ncbi:putative Integral membrane protein [Seiridium unicorne]|uniref:Integral membrane protein n=1 Tax=Seiridium unicorne TaxID=138068 RepID=A0ABR2V0T7_9PEZI
MVVEVGGQVPAGEHAIFADLKTSIPILVFGSIALYNVVELNYMIIGTFRRRKSLYFWSLIVATWGIALNAVGYLLEHLKLIQAAQLYSTLICVGWVCMVTGQSVVLYSRLHLVMADDRRRRAVLYMIIFDAIAMHIPVIVLVYGSNSGNPAPYLRPYSIYEKVQLTVFFVQEVIISGLYVWETMKLLRVTRDLRGKRGARRVMTHLIFVNLVVIILDVSVLALEFSDFYDLQTGYKPLVYSIKLKMELSILNQLVSLTRSASQGSFSLSNSNGPSQSITLDTLNQNPQRRLRADIGGGNMGYKASVGSSGQHDAEFGSHGYGARVVRETEVSVEPRAYLRGGSSRHNELGGPSRSSMASERDIADAAVSTTSLNQIVGVAP